MELNFAIYLKITKKLICNFRKKILNLYLQFEVNFTYRTYPMQFFIHHCSILVQEDTQNVSSYQHILDFQQITFSGSLFKGLSGNLLLFNATIEYFKQLILFLDKNEHTSIQEIIIVVEDIKKFKKELKIHFEVVEAAGGVVQEQGKCLMIFRRGKWDLPKGKIDEGEDAPTAALREIAEECGIEATIQEKICSTWHHYWNGGKIVLKKTKWYLMNTPTPEAIKPQIEEDIEKIVWMDKKEIEKALENSFSSIAYVIKLFYALSKHS
ncbi:MAG: hypothetical protein OHK0045_05950 [Raineya sp.]